MAQELLVGDEVGGEVDSAEVLEIHFWDDTSNDVVVELQDLEFGDFGIRKALYLRDFIEG